MNIVNLLTFLHSPPWLVCYHALSEASSCEVVSRLDPVLNFGKAELNGFRESYNGSHSGLNLSSRDDQF